MSSIPVPLNAYVERLSAELDKRHRLVRSHGSQRLDPGGQRLSRYRFRHILFQKYIYSSLEEAERSYLHEAVGLSLEHLYEGQTRMVAIRLARHFQGAGLALRAIDYLRQAGEQAVRSFAYQEAITVFNQALALLRTMPENPERDQRELALQIALGVPLMAARGFSAPEVETAYIRARELCQQKETPRLFQVLWGLWLIYSARGECRRAQGLGEQLLNLAQRLQDTALLLQAHHTLWSSLLPAGAFTEARLHIQQGMALYDPQQHHVHTSLYGGHDPGVCCRCFAGPTLWFLGYPDQALQRMREAVALAQELSHPLSLAESMFYLAILHQFRRDEQATQVRTETAVAFAAKHGIRLWEGWGMGLRGWVLAQRGHGEAGLAQIHEGLTAWQRPMQDGLLQPYFLALLAEVYGQMGRVEEGLGAVAEGLAAAHQTGECCYEAELYRLKGMLILKRGEDAAAVGSYNAEVCFQRAIEIARQQHAKSLELRAAVSLSQLWQKQSKRAGAYQMLAKIYNWFTEGFDTADLKEAKALLEKLT